MVKTEKQNESTIDMFDDKFYLIMEQDFFAKTKANETSEAVLDKEELDTDSDETEIDNDYATVSGELCLQSVYIFRLTLFCLAESEHNTEPMVNHSLSSSSGERQMNCRQKQIKIHKCVQWGKSFKCSSHLKTHHLVHTGMRAHKCPKCFKTFGQKCDLKRHQLVHTGIREHQCPTCFKSFRQRGTLVKHQLVHSSIRFYKCILCSKSFAQKCDLVKHQFVHNGIWVYKCTTCSKTFGFKNNLKNTS